MSERLRLISMLAIMAISGLFVTGFALYELYETAINEQRIRLEETAQSQARLIESVAEFNSDHSTDDAPGGDISATLSQIEQAHLNYENNSSTCDFGLAKLEDNKIVFLLMHGNRDNSKHEPLPLSSNLAEPMKRALNGESGSMIGLDLDGDRVMAAYEPISGLNLGLVAKININTIRAPFIKGGWVILGDIVLLLILGVILFIRVGIPLLKSLEKAEHAEVLRKANQELTRQIKERHKAESKVLEQTELLELFFKHTLDCVVLLDRDYNFIRVNDAYAKACQREASEFPGHNHFEFFPSDAIEIFDEVVYTKLPYQVEAKPFTYVDQPEWGVSYWDWTLVPVLDKDGYVEMLVFTLRDVTERIAAKNALAEEEQSRKALVSVLPDMVFRISGDGTYLDYNSSGSEDLILPRDELIGRKVAEVLPAELAERTMVAIVDTLRTGKTEHLEYELKIGSDLRFFEARLIKSGDSEVICIVRNVTEMKRLRDQESRAQRLEIAGTIAGQVAHDFNNLLAPLVAFPEFIREELTPGHSALVYVDDIEKSALQIADINQQLLTLSRRGHYNQEPVNLNSIVTTLTNQLRNLPASVEIKTNLSEDLMNTMGGVAQLSRVVLNLVNNAIDAVHGNGRISITTKNYYMDESAILFDKVPTGEYVKLAVTDTGVGISDDVITQILDPFFTTKTSDKIRGSGLGLSVVSTVLKDHNGYLDISTKIGEGSSFYLYLPVTREDTAKIVLGNLPRGSETVLVVDDDSVQRKVTLKLLKRLGYDAVAEDSGENALKRLKNERFDLLILDMIMPSGIDGAETYEGALKFNDQQKVILVSGYAETERVTHAQNLGAGSYIRKPLMLESLATAVREELSREAVKTVRI